MAWLLGELKKLISFIEAELEKATKLIGPVLEAVFAAEEQQIMVDFYPDLKQIAINLQNEQPGLNANDFMAALMAAALPVLEQEGVKMAQTALSILVATVTKELNVPITSGNTGNLPGGVQS